MRSESALHERIIGALGPVALVVVLVVAWQVANLPRYVVPRPSEVLDVFKSQPEFLWHHTEVTAGEVLISFAISVVVGVPVGLLSVKSRMFNRGVYPLIVASQSVPILAAAPLLVVWFGFGLAPKVIVAVLITFFPIVIGTALGIQTLPSEFRMLARTVGLGRFRTLWLVEWPASLPSIFGGLTVATVLVVVGAVVGEFVGSSAGLGYLVLRSTGTLDNAMLFAALLVMVVMGISAFLAVTLAERLLTPWRFGTAD